MADSNKPVGEEHGLEPMLQAHIGKKLRELYDGMAQEPVPDRFRLLLDQLEAGEPSEPPEASAAETASSDLPIDLADSV